MGQIRRPEQNQGVPRNCPRPPGEAEPDETAAARNNQMIKQTILRFVFGLTIFAAAAPLSALPTFVRANPNGDLRFGLLDRDSTSTIKGTFNGGNFRDHTAGTFDLEIADNSNFHGATSILAYCFQPFEGISGSDISPFGVFDNLALGSSGVGASLTDGQEDLLAALWANAFGMSAATGSDRDVRAGAFQWLVWDIIIDGALAAPLSLTTGNLQIQQGQGGVGQAILSLGTQWAQLLNNGTWQPEDTQLNVLQLGQVQDLGFEPVPEPGTMILTGFGLLTLGIYRRRQDKSRK